MQIRKDVVQVGRKLIVPAGITLHIPITAMHRNKANWEND